MPQPETVTESVIAATEQAVSYEQLEPTDGASVDQVDLAPVADVTVEVVVEIGRRRMTIGEALDLVPGAVVPLGRPSDEPVDIVVNGLRIARGEVVVVDEEFGVRLTEVTGRKPATAAPDDAADA